MIVTTNCLPSVTLAQVISDPGELAWFAQYWAERDGVICGVLAREFGFIDEHDVCVTAGLPKKFRGRGWLWRRIAKSLNSYCAERGHIVARIEHMGDRLPFWHRLVVEAWLEEIGQRVIADFMAKPGRSAQILAFNKGPTP